MTNQMSPKMKQELENILEDMQALELGMWELIAMTDAVIQYSKGKGSTKKSERKT